MQKVDVQLVAARGEVVSQARKASFLSVNPPPLTTPGPSLHYVRLHFGSKSDGVTQYCATPPTQKITKGGTRGGGSNYP